MRAVPITAELIRDLLSYDEVTGIFRWAISNSNAAPVGSIAGTLGPRGYRRIAINRRCYSAHRLAWLYVHGVWPGGEVDHRDGDPGNNSIGNLRLASHGQNIANSKRRSDNACGIKGVSYRKHIQKWQARICKNGVSIELGCWSTAEEARAAYQAAAQRLFGQFARPD